VSEVGLLLVDDLFFYGAGGTRFHDGRFRGGCRFHVGVSLSFRSDVRLFDDLDFVMRCVC
jgi:hypothetical protein